MIRTSLRRSTMAVAATGAAMLMALAPIPGRYAGAAAPYDPYADFVQASEFVTSPLNATGAPDGNVADVRPGGTILFDMGAMGTGALRAVYTAKDASQKIEVRFYTESSGEIAKRTATVDLPPKSTDHIFDFNYRADGSAYRFVRLTW